MKYICSNPQCGRQSIHMEIDPKCISCGSVLIPEYKDGYRGIWMSPETVISRFEGLIKKFGFNEIIKNNRFKHEREGWVSGVWALGITEITGKENFIEIETIQETPDTHVFYFDIINGNNHRQVFDVEVVDWEEHTGELIEIIKNKSSKNYPQNFTLLIYARHPGKEVNMEEIYKEVQHMNIPFGQIWVLGSSDVDDYDIFQIYGVKNHIKFNLSKLREKYKNQIPFSKFLMRGKGTDIENLGVIYLPLQD